jgi:hypothetical protein
VRCTIAEALRDMRRLYDVDAGRLRGETAYLSGYTANQPPAAAPQPWADHLATLIGAGRAGTITPDTPRYVVYSDNQVFAWLTVHARVVAPPDMPLTANQAKHQRHDVVREFRYHSVGLRRVAQCACVDLRGRLS